MAVQWSGYNCAMESLAAEARSMHWAAALCKFSQAGWLRRAAAAAASLSPPMALDFVLGPAAEVGRDSWLQQV